MDSFAKLINKPDHPENTVTFRFTHLYAEATFHQGNIDWIIYLIPISDFRLLTAACCDDTFSFLDKIDEGFLEDLEDTWPITVKLIRNSIKYKYSDALLLQMEDLDNGDLKWFVASILGNFDLVKMLMAADSADDPMIDKRLERKMEFVLVKTADAHTEVTTKDINTWSFWWRNLKRGFFSGVMKGTELMLSEMIKTSVSGIVKDVVSHVHTLPDISANSPQVFKSGHPVGPGPLRF